MSKPNTKPSSGDVNPSDLGMSADDWKALRALTDAEIIAAAESDPDAPPLTDEQLARMQPVSRARFVRRKLALSLDQFADRYGIPIATLRSWERHETEPTVTEAAYLDAILRAPEAVRRPFAA
jgi:putative transcriptional regulator